MLICCNSSSVDVTRGLNFTKPIKKIKHFSWTSTNTLPHISSAGFDASKECPTSQGSNSPDRVRNLQQLLPGTYDGSRAAVEQLNGDHVVSVVVVVEVNNFGTMPRAALQHQAQGPFIGIYKNTLNHKKTLS